MNMRKLIIRSGNTIKITNNLKIMKKLHLLGVAVILTFLNSCTPPPVQGSNIVGKWLNVEQKNMGGYEISQVSILTITKESSGEFGYELNQTVRDEMYGSEKYSTEKGKLDGEVDDKKWRFSTGQFFAERGGYIVVPSDNWDDYLPNEISIRFAENRGSLMIFSRTKESFSDEEFRDMKDDVLSQFNPPGGSIIEEDWINKIKTYGYDEAEAVYIFNTYALTAIENGYDLDVVGMLVYDYQIDQDNKLLQEAPAVEEGEFYDKVKAAYEEYSGKSSIIKGVKMQWSDGPSFGGIMILEDDIVLEWSSENGDWWSFSQE